MPASSSDFAPPVPPPWRERIGVAGDVVDRVEIEAEPVGEDLRESRRVALPRRAGADAHAHAAGRQEADIGFLLRLRRRHFHVIGDAEAQELAAAARLFAPRLEVREIGDVECALEIGREIAAVIRDQQRRLPRHVGGAHQIAAADLVAAEPGLARRRIDQPLDDVGAFRPAGAAIGIDPDRVGHHRAHMDMRRRNAIGAGQQAKPRHGRDEHREMREIGADIGQRVGAHGEEMPVLVERELGMDFLLAALRVDDERFLPVAEPFDRPAELLRGPGQQRVLREVEGLHPEAAADIAGDDAQSVVLDAEMLRHRAAQAESALRADMQRVALGLRIVFGEDAARLERRDHDAVDREIERHDLRRLGESLVAFVAVAQAPIERNIARLLVPQHRRARLHRLGRIDHRRQRGVIDLDQIERVLRRGQTIGDHQRDRIADMAHFIRRQQRPAGIEEIGAVAVLERRDAFDAAEAGGLHIGAGIDREHAGHALCRGHIDAVDRRMRMRRAQESGIGLSRRALVIDIAAAAGDEAHILAPPHRLADSELTH